MPSITLRNNTSMASLTEHNLAKLIETYSLHTFVESGYGNGGSFRFAKQHGFLQWFSCDVIKESAMKGRDAWPEDCVAHCNSITMVSAIQQARMVLGIDMGNVLWWLDAHFPGVDTGFLDWESSHDQFGITNPAESELQAIMLGPHENDVILIDDAFLFRAGLINHRLEDRVPAVYKRFLGSLEPFLDSLSATHRIKQTEGITGALSLYPKAVE